MADSPIKKSQGLVTCTLYKEGNKINSRFGLISVRVSKEANRIGKATLCFSAGNVASQNVEESEDDTFAPGSKIRIEAGYLHEENILFEGIVTTHQVIASRQEGFLLEIECRDYAFPTTLTRRNRLFEKSKESDAISQITGEYGNLSADVEATSVVHPELIQYYCTDWDFILSRAEANGLVVINEGEKITVRKPNLSATPVLSLTYGTDIIEFDGRLQASDQIDALSAWAWDSTAQKLVTVDGASPSLNNQGDSSPAVLAKAVEQEKMSLQTLSVADQGVLQAWANGTLLRSALARIQGSVTFQGNSKIVPGCLIEINGLGKRFNGNAYIGKVEHEIREGNWTTTAGMGLSPALLTERPDVPAPLASGIVPGINGLHIGKVVQMAECPEENFRIQVELPLLNGDKNTVWARLSTLWASNGFGAFFFPEPGDEVVVGFFNNDPNFPVVLGSLYSSQQKPPYPVKKENFTKGIVTRTKLKIEFDEEKKVLRFETPGENVIELSDDAKSIRLTDMHKNEIEMTSSGIRIESAKEIQLKAKTHISVEAGGNLSLQAKSKNVIEGMSIEAKAQSSVTVKGGATAELSASGQTTVKGGVVMIN